MTDWQPVPDEDFLTVLLDFTVSAFRLEQQPSYAEPVEDDLYAAWLHGERPDPTAVPALAGWFAAVRAHTDAGRTITRVRIHEAPPTAYQDFMRWLDPWNRAAGERMLYLSRPDADRVALTDAAGSTDWWLLDDALVLIMRHDPVGRRVANEVTTDRAVVREACAVRDLALAHAVPLREALARP